MPLPCVLLHTLWKRKLIWFTGFLAASNLSLRSLSRSLDDSCWHNSVPSCCRWSSSDYLWSRLIGGATLPPPPPPPFPVQTFCDERRGGIKTAFLPWTVLLRAEESRATINDRLSNWAEIKWVHINLVSNINKDHLLCFAVINSDNLPSAVLSALSQRGQSWAFCVCSGRETDSSGEMRQLNVLGAIKTFTHCSLIWRYDSNQASVCWKIKCRQFRQKNARLTVSNDRSRNTAPMRSPRSKDCYIFSKIPICIFCWLFWPKTKLFLMKELVGL